MINGSPCLVVLGAGVAGLGVGFYATQRQMPFTIVEAASYVGGNARTFEVGPFRLDTGAHRFHDRFPEVTADVLRLLGSDLARVDAPSQIFWRNTFVDFPLTPVSLVRSLGPALSARAASDFLRARVAGAPAAPNFEATAVHSYGRTIAELFLLGYSEKLWGVPASRLSPSVSGRRLHGLSATVLARELLGRASSRRHLDGRFYYPRHGIGMLADRLSAACGSRNINLESRVTRISHSDGRLISIQLNGREELDVADACVVSTLAPGIVLERLSPAPPPEVLAAARALRFRNIVLVSLFIARPSVTRNATIYFPDPACPFTRISEPRNRSPFMAPAGRTSLSIEIPCWTTDAHWTDSDDALIRQCADSLHALGICPRDAVSGGVVHRLPFAYPVLEIDADAKVRQVHSYLARFENLRIVGRSGLFSYVHLHDLLRSARELVESVQGWPARAGDVTAAV